MPSRIARNRKEKNRLRQEIFRHRTHYLYGIEVTATSNSFFVDDTVRDGYVWEGEEDVVAAVCATPHQDGLADVPLNVLKDVLAAMAAGNFFPAVVESGGTRGGGGRGEAEGEAGPKEGAAGGDAGGLAGVGGVGGGGDSGEVVNEDLKSIYDSLRERDPEQENHEEENDEDNIPGADSTANTNRKRTYEEARDSGDDDEDQEEEDEGSAPKRLCLEGGLARRMAKLKLSTEHH